MNSALPKALIAHPGTQYAPRLAAELQRLGLLFRFATGFAIPEDGWLGSVDQLIPAKLRRRWANRRISHVPASHLALFPSHEWLALARMRRGEPVERVLFERNRAFQGSIPDAWLSDVDEVIGFDTSSWLLARRRRELGKPFTLDQSIGHPVAKERVYECLRNQYPPWSEALSKKSPAALEAETEEHQSASRVVVASEFSKTTLTENGVSADKISVVPYGVDLERFKVRDYSPSVQRPFRFMFAGLVNARKGVPLLLDAWRKCAGRGAELWLVGPLSNEVRVLIGERDGVRIFGARPHQELPELFRQCDVFVFPSYFEGFGLVLLEAMASGLPIIATDATAAPELLDGNDAGFVVPSGDVDALAERMTWFLEDRDRASHLGVRARRTAEGFTWVRYGDCWGKLLKGPNNLPAVHTELRSSAVLPNPTSSR